MTAVDSPLAHALRDRYLLELGHGGVATVYLACDLKHKHPLALKVLHCQLALGCGRFHREIKPLADLKPPRKLTMPRDDAPAPRWFAP